MARRSDHSREELKELALAAAEKIVIEQGHEGLSARKVATAIGYSAGSLYLVFENLDDLILQINAHTLDRLHKSMTQVQSKTLDPQQQLLQIGETYISFANKDPNRWSMVYQHRMADDHDIPEWYQNKVTRMFTIIEKSLQSLVNNKSAQEITLAAKALWGGVHGICVLAQSGNLGVVGVDSVQALTLSLMNNYLKGFIGK